MSAMLEVKGLKVFARVRGGEIPLVRGLDFTLSAGETLGLVGESGSGKTVICLALLGLHPQGQIRVEAETLRFEGRDLLRLTPAEWRRLRGREIAMVFQDPMTSLNPLMRCGEQVAESIRLHQGRDRKQARLAALELLEQMGLPEPERRYRQYPFELSGGMRQRVMIAAALSCRPKLLIADEPTTALDVTLQAQILELIRSRRRDGMALLLITHDLAVARENVENLLVLYAGGAVERGEAAKVLGAPRHPYTLGLLQSLPPWEGRMRRLLAIEGVVPHPAESVPGCRFHPRCAFAGERCRNEIPQWAEDRAGGASSCHFADQISAPGRRR